MGDIDPQAAVEAARAEREAELQARMRASHRVTVRHAVEVLNRALEADPQAIMDLVAARVPVNQALASDPEIQVDAKVVDGKVDPDSFRVGLLGIINGIFGTTSPNGPGYIVANFESVGGPITSFGVSEL